MDLGHLVLLVLLAQGPASPPAAPAGVEGLVVKAGTGEPVTGANVELFGRGAGVHTATTAQDGRFVFENVAPGTYRLAATKTGGFVPAEYGQRSPGGAGASFELA